MKKKALILFVLLLTAFVLYAGGIEPVHNDLARVSITPSNPDGTYNLTIELATSGTSSVTYNFSGATLDGEPIHKAYGPSKGR